ncbi:hypothetical protein AC629_42580 [Bradyrhizobium sp. NAS80.1]|nr:hypothetical protein AC629_42580 [Bradyrhizobium sp. NAS80.1]
MSLRVASPAPLPDVMDLFAASVPMKPINVKAAIVQAARSESFAFYAGAGAIAAAMLYPLPAEKPGERLVELAFVCRPELAQHLRALLRLAHLTRDQLANDGPVRVRAHVRSGHLPGSRLAALLGMRMVGTFGGFERFEFEGSPHECIRPGRQDAVHGAGHLRPR